MKYFVLITILVAFSLADATQVFAETLPNGETISAKTNDNTFKLDDTIQLTIEDYNYGALKNIDIIKSTYPGIIGPCGIAYFDFVFLRGDHTNISTFDDLVAAKNDAINVAYDMPYNIFSCPFLYSKSIKGATLESNSNNATITYANGNDTIAIKSQLIQVNQIVIPFGKESFSYGKYTIVAFSMSGKISKPLPIEVIAHTGVSLDKTIHPIVESPLKQFKSGIPVEKITCGEGRTLMLKASTHIPICIKNSSILELHCRNFTNDVWNASYPICDKVQNSITKSPTNYREIKVLSITPENVTLPDPKPKVPAKHDGLIQE